MHAVQYHTRLTAYDIHLFREGKHYTLYEKLGSHLIEKEGIAGVQFAVWVPNAVRVAVMGDFNKWSINAHHLYKRGDDSGIWEGFIPHLHKGALYKYFILSADGRPLEKGDPFARFWETPPNTASIVWDTDYDWQDAKWMQSRSQKNGLEAPMSVYEVHLGSWKKKENGDSLNYRELAATLVPYVQQMGFTHVELLPVMEHPYYPSWGYQVTGYFAPSSRYGTPQDFMYLMDAFHRAGIGVLLDWVPSHFPGDAHALADFDGTHLYEHADPRKGFHPDWKSYIFNYGRYEVRSFLISNALFWIEKYHADGLRVDAVASMVYLDYSREEGEWMPNELGGRENLEAISFLKEFNEVVYEKHPDAITIAEESTAWPKVSRPTYEGGLGFGQKWMMGWMHDTLKYFKEDPINRKYHHGSITFSIVYAFSENFMLPLSHDEVVHLKASLLGKMPGEEWQRFANLRLLYGYMFTHPGTKLLFMGGEFAQSFEWSESRGLDWPLTQYDYHSKMQRLITDLNQLYKNSPALYELQFEKAGFEWIDQQDHERSILIYLRKGRAASRPLLVVCNFTPVVRKAYKTGVPYAATWTEILNTDAKKYCGTGITNKPLKSTPEKATWHNRDHVILPDLPPLAVIVFEANKKPPATKSSASASESKSIPKAPAQKKAPKIEKP